MTVDVPGIAVAVGLAVILIPLSRWLLRAVANQIVREIQPHWQHDLTDALAGIREELTTNGGSSIKDQVSEIWLRMGNLEQQIERVLEER